MDTIRLEVSDSQVILLYLPCDKKDIVLLTDVSLTYWRDGKRVCDVFVRDFPADEFFVWSTPTEVGTETYIYNVDNEIYLEICPLYKWNCDSPDDEDEYQTFEEFLHDYQMIDLIHIERDTALQCQKKLHELLEIAQANELIYRIN